ATVLGMHVSFANVEVSSPQVVVDFNNKHRDKDFEQQLVMQEQDYLHRREADQVQHTQSMESTALSHEQQLDGRRDEHNREMSTAGTAHDLKIQGIRAEHARTEFDRNMSMIDGDPRRALLAAFAGGRINASELAQQLRELDDQDRVALVAKAEREF